MVTLVPDSNGEDNAPVFLRLQEFNKCHNPEGAGGGQFCSTGPHAVTVVPAKGSGLSASTIEFYTKYRGPEGTDWWVVKQGDHFAIQSVSQSFGGHRMIMAGPNREEERAMNSYVDQGFRALNAGLRNGTGGPDDYLDRLIERNVLDQPVTVYRSLHSDFLQGLPVGTQVEDKAYVSTTWRRSVADDIITQAQTRVEDRDLRPRHVVTIDLPKGQRALEVEQWESDARQMYQRAENEYLLPRGTRFEVTEVDTQGRVVRMKAVPR